MKSRSGKIVSIHAAADGEAAHAQILDAVFHLLRGQRRVLQGQAAKARKAFRVRGAQFRYFLVLNLDDFAREILHPPNTKMD